MPKNPILITGGAGFIGIHLLRVLVGKYPHYHFVNVDSLTEASNIKGLDSISNHPNYSFYPYDICNKKQMEILFKNYEFEGIIHLAAETHVDKSIVNPSLFVHSNIVGTVHLLELTKTYCQQNPSFNRFYHVSTDEVYGHLGPAGSFIESDPYLPRSPYAASKAAADHFVKAFHHTYGLPIVLSHCTNNYGPYQSDDKFIPQIVTNALNKQPIKVYGKGDNIRDWLFVSDHVEAIDCIFHRGTIGQSYNIGADNPINNISLVNKIIHLLESELNQAQGSFQKLITHVPDRLGHDFRYALNKSKITQELNWKPTTRFDDGLKQTIDYYSQNVLT
ncbi:MAG: dTDP-glucose 4,6-dehydratase [Flavobacteriaceae bacterium]|nr:dTDP-glucose 4,6-dehydratase [Flavobacteriaceae bacterium]MCY4217179.1 dTDP-glucose 4,6-dehydratase [Flavobacteriaceae bacterium]MCY4254365.1 dTDP-glucose 4,6-dehydratase [Flavobacteriaceae bacterium]